MILNKRKSNRIPCRRRRLVDEAVRSCGNPRIDIRMFRQSQNKRKSSFIPGDISPADPPDPSRTGKFQQIRGQGRGDDRHNGSAFQKGRNLSGRHVSATDNQDRPTGQIQIDGITLHDSVCPIKPSFFQKASRIDDFRAYFDLGNCWISLFKRRTA